MMYFCFVFLKMNNHILVKYHNIYVGSLALGCVVYHTGNGFVLL